MHVDSLHACRFNELEFKSTAVLKPAVVILAIAVPLNNKISLNVFAFFDPNKYSVIFRLL